MKPTHTLLPALLLLTPLAAEEACCAAPSAPPPAATATDTPSTAPVGHPLRGVIVDILPEKSALLVTHDEIPGVMRAMTMLLKVDAATLAAATKDTAITATLLKKSDGWWLENVAPVPKAKID